MNFSLRLWPVSQADMKAAVVSAAMKNANAVATLGGVYGL